MTYCFRSLPQTVPIHCHNLDRMPLDMLYMVCFSTNLRNIFNNCSYIIIGIWNINSYIYTHGSCGPLCSCLLLLHSCAILSHEKTKMHCDLFFLTQLQKLPNDLLYRLKV